jgi:hypothetical protein
MGQHRDIPFLVQNGSKQEFWQLVQTLSIARTKWLGNSRLNETVTLKNTPNSNKLRLVNKTTFNDTSRKKFKMVVYPSVKII